VRCTSAQTSKFRSQSVRTNKEILLPFTQHDLSPYSSHVLAQCTSADSNSVKKIDVEIAAVMESAMRVITAIVEHPRRVTNGAMVPGKISKTDFIAVWQIQPGLRCAACIYVEERSVTWLPRGGATDKLTHLLIVTVSKSGLLLLTATDTDHRAALLQHLQLGRFTHWKPLPQAILVQAIVEGAKMKTLWLSGVHRDTAVKPTSKIISGSDLVDAIDPMNDSSFLAGAVRSTKGGVSLRNSSVWTGPNTSLVAFEARTVNLLTLVEQAIKANPAADLQVHSALASWAHDIKEAKNCYAVSHADYETLDSASGKAKAKKLSGQFMVELKCYGAPTGKPGWYFVVLVTEIVSNQTAVVEVEPRLVDGSVQYQIAPIPAAPFDFWANAVTESATLLRAYYDSGHTITGGTLARVRRQDAPFKRFRYGDFTNYNVTQEKPRGPMVKKNGKTYPGPVPIEDMMTVNDKSLFKWIHKEGLTLLKLKQPKPNKVWIYCDDGSSEVGDFIHLDIQSKPKRLTLIHAKGASSAKATRRTAPGPYELVASQATKNLRAFDSKKLLVRIKNRLARKGGERIWDQPWAVGLTALPNSTGFETALDNLGADYVCEVIIVQPHVRQSDFIKRVGKDDTVGAEQLRTLLFGVESLARSVNATFRVVADKR
jgi:hypothetical protein